MQLVLHKRPNASACCTVPRARWTGLIFAQKRSQAPAPAQLGPKLCYELKLVQRCPADHFCMLQYGLHRAICRPHLQVVDLDNKGPCASYFCMLQCELQRAVCSPQGQAVYAGLLCILRQSTWLHSHQFWLLGSPPVRMTCPLMSTIGNLGGLHCLLVMKAHNSTRHQNVKT